MASEIVDIDHLMLSVSDSTEAGEIFEKMGFSITPRGQLPGMSNRLVCFSNGQDDSPNFVELMSLDNANEAPPAMAQALRIPDRPVLLVAASSDAQATFERLNKSGLNTSPVLESGRNWELPSGEIIDLSFSIVLPGGGQAPFYWIACQHNTPQHYLREEFVRHSNNSTALSKIIALAGDPMVAADHYEKFWGMKKSFGGEVNDPVIVSGNRVSLHIYSQDSFHAAFPGINLTRTEDHIVGFVAMVEQLGLLEKQLRDNGFNPIKLRSTLALDPSEACGCLVLFEVDGQDANP